MSEDPAPRTRSIKLRVNWESEPWMRALTRHQRFAFISLLCYVKFTSPQHGRIKFGGLPDLAERLGYCTPRDVKDLEMMIRAAVKESDDGNSDKWFPLSIQVTGHLQFNKWEIYQDSTAIQRKKFDDRRKQKREELRHAAGNAKSEA